MRNNEATVTAAIQHNTDLTIRLKASPSTTASGGSTEVDQSYTHEQLTC